MKKLFLLAAIVATVETSCVNEPISEKTDWKEETTGVKEGMIPYEATVRFNATKSTIDGTKIVWEVGDKVAIFDDVNPEQPNEFTVVAVTGDGAYIKGEISGSSTKLYGVYPFSAAVSLAISSGAEEAEDSVTVNLPSVQTIEAGKVIASDALVTVTDKTDVGSEEFYFGNPFSVIGFKIPVEGIEKVVFSGLDGKGVTGNQTIGTEGGGITLKGETSLTVTNADGFVKDVTYYATVFSRDVEGLKFVLTADDYKAVVESSKTAEFKDNEGLVFNFTETQIDTTKCPFNIYTKEDLKAFAKHSAWYDAGEWVNLCADIDYDSTWVAVADFEGNFNGNNHSIYGSTVGVTFKANTAYPYHIGFFSQIYGEVKDLKLGYNPSTESSDSFSDLTYSETIQYAGVLAGAAASRDGVGPVKVTNVQNYIGHYAAYTTATGAPLYAGNITGYLSCDDAQFTDCKNYGVIGNISLLASCVTDSHFAGIVGLPKANNVTFTRCENYGDIKIAHQTTVGKGNYYAGGIAARVGSGSTNMQFINCKSLSKNKISSCRNVKQQVFLGGILGADNTSTSVIMQGCVNECPRIEMGSQSKNCAAGGMIGFAKGKINLDGCINGSALTDTLGRMEIGGNNLLVAGYGGMVGYINGSTGVISNCTNYAAQPMEEGKVISKNTAKGLGRGGIVGLAIGSSSSVSIENCKNYGDITMKYGSKWSEDGKTWEDPTTFALGSCIGGIIGNNQTALSISKCENYGNLTEINDARTTEGGEKHSITGIGAGGLVGYYGYATFVTGYASDCKVDCAVTTEAGGMILGNSKKGATYGTDAAKIKVRGSYNDTTLDSGNYTNYLYPLTGVTPTFKTEYWEK